LLFSYLACRAIRARPHGNVDEVFPCANFAAMKANNSKKDTITAPLLKDVIARDKACQQADRQNVSIGSKPLNPPALYEDQGEGYNANYVFPQE
jgi:hypothetical protein